MEVSAGSSTMINPIPGPSSAVPGTSGLPKGPKKRPCLSDRILFAKARLNRISQRKKLLFMDSHEDKFGEYTHLSEDEQLLEAAKAGKDTKVKMLLSQGNCDKGYVDDSGRSALHWVAVYGYMRVLYTLIEVGWNINHMDHKKQTPLHVACDHRNGNIAACLISHGCKIRTMDVSGVTPLHRAIHSNLETIACMLCNLGADVNAKSNSGWTPLHEASRIGNEYLVKKLIKDGANVNAIAECNSSPFLTAVFYYRISQRAAYNCLEPILYHFIDNGSQLSLSDGQWTPLNSAIALYNSKVAGKLIYHGCQIPDPQKFGRSILVETFTKCDDYVTKLLVHAGYHPSPDEVELCARRIPTFSLTFLRLAFPEYEGGKGRHELEIVKFLREATCQPFSLQAICRKSIRHALNRASRDSSILGRIPLLPLPEKLKQYISLREYAIRFI